MNSKKRPEKPTFKRGFVKPGETRPQRVSSSSGLDVSQSDNPARMPFIPPPIRAPTVVVFHGVGDVRLENVPEPKIKDANDAIVRITASAICATDLHFIRGNCNHRKYLPRLIEMVRSGLFDPEQFFTKNSPLKSAIDAYHHFDQHEHGWLKVKLEPDAVSKAA